MPAIDQLDGAAEGAAAKAADERRVAIVESTKLRLDDGVEPHARAGLEQTLLQRHHALLFVARLVLWQRRPPLSSCILRKGEPLVELGAPLRVAGTIGEGDEGGFEG